MRTFIEILESFGCETKHTKERMCDDEFFYYQYLMKTLRDPHLTMLKQDIIDKKMDSAFANAHTLKGLYLLFGFDPIIDTTNHMVETLRNKKWDGVEEDFKKIHKFIQELFRTIQNDSFSF